jgi:hypothetical protein
MEKIIRRYIDNAKDQSTRDKRFYYLERWIGLRNGIKDGFAN